MKKIPLFDLVIDEEKNSGVTAVALVDRPAIMVNWIAFKEDKEPVRFKIADEDRRILTGPIMIPNINIYRNDEFGEYYLRASVQTVEKMAIKFARNKNLDKINLMHDSKDVPKDVFLFETWLIDKKRGIHPPDGFDVPYGTWMGSVYVDNDEVWKRVKAGEYFGFSMEGEDFGIMPQGDQWEEAMEALNNLLITKSN